MVRILKEPEVRKAEIMDVALEFFNVKGYEQTSVNEIIEKVGIAKGTFYYYFKSKNELLDEVIERGTYLQIKQLKMIIELNKLNAFEKMQMIFLENQRIWTENERLIEYLHGKENIVAHQKTMVQLVKNYAPLISELIEQGINEGNFTTDYPLEISEFILTVFSFLFDSSIFPRSKAEYLTRIKAMTEMIELTLRAPKGSFSFLSEIYEKSKLR